MLISLEFEVKFVAYLGVASLSVLLWDILNNVKNDYHLLFRHRIGLATIVYFLSRVSVLGFILVATMFFTTPSIPCTVFKTIFISFFISNMMCTPFLAYLRVCAVWHWNRFIVGFFGASWLAVAGSSFTGLSDLTAIQVAGFCTEIVTAKTIVTPFVAVFFNHTVIFLAITYGVCKNSMGRDVGFRDSIWLMIGKGLPTFSKALLHDSQVSYLIIMLIGAATIAWCYVWTVVQPISAFRLALVPPYAVLTNIMICRVFRNTKLGLNSKVPVQSNTIQSSSDTRLPMHAGPDGTISWNSRHNTTNASFSTTPPFTIDQVMVIDHKGNHSNFLDFGMV